MKILITGASGFIGSFLVNKALACGYETWAAIRKGSNKANLQDKRIHFIELAYNDQELLISQLEAHKKTFGSWDYVIHNAGITKTLDKNDFMRVNALYTHHLIEALHTAACDPKKFLLMSSLSAFGKGDEETFKPIQLTDTPQPNTAYGKSKLAAERFLIQQDYFSYVILRPTGVYGPGEKDYFLAIQSIQAGFNFAVGLTKQHLTFIYVKDLVAVAFAALENSKIINKAYFVADGDVYTDDAFAKMIKLVIGKQYVLNIRIPLKIVWIACHISEWMGRITKKTTTLNSDKYIIFKQRNWICDIQPLEEELGFKADYPLQKGLEECTKWYREQKWL